MMNADEMRKATKVDEKWVKQLIDNAYAGMLAAAEKGQRHCGVWVYDRHYHKWLGDIPDAVVEEAERQLIEAGYTIRSRGRINACIERVVEW